MTGRIWRRLATPIRGLHQAAYWLAGLTLASQALALIRDRTFAHIFGASTTLDMYYAAFKIPNLMFTFVASLVSAYILIPRITNDTHDEARTLISQAASFLLLVASGVAVVIAIFVPQLAQLFFPRFADSSQAPAFIMLIRLLLLQPILLGLTGVIASVTQVHRRFIIYSLSPVLYNLGIIFGALVLYPRFGLIGIGYGVLLGSFAYFIIHVPIVISAKLFPRLVWPSWRIMKSIMRDSIPRTLALGTGSIVILAITIFAARAGSGVISIFTFATNLEAVPLALIGSSYAVAAFPVLSELSGIADRKKFSNILSAAARHLVVWSIIMLSLVIILRAHLVRVILGTGNFNWADTRLTSAVLAMLVLGLAAQGLILLLSRALYAVHQSWRPLWYQLTGGAISISIAGGGLYYLHRAPEVLALFGGLFRAGNVSGNIVLVFALAVVLGQLVTAALLLAATHRVAPGFLMSLVRPFVHSVISGAVGASFAYETLALMGNIAPLTTLAAVFTQALIAGIVGLIAVGATLALLHNQEFVDMRRAVHRLVRRKKSLPTFDDAS